MLRLRTLGVMELVHTGEGVVTSILRQPKRFALFAYLACRRRERFATRDELLGIFWQDLDMKHARDALNRALHYLRRRLPPDTLPSLGRALVGVEPGALSCDALDFREHLDAGSDQDVLSLYEGEFLAGLHVDGAAAFHQWLDRERAWYRWQAKAAGLRLVGVDLDRGRVSGALRWVEALNRIATHDEEVVRATVRTRMRAGDRAGALAYLERFESWLREVEGVGVPADLVRLLDSPLTRERTGSDATHASMARDPSPELLEESRAAIRVETLDEHRAFIDQLPDLAYRCDLRGSFPFVNEATVKRCGYSREEFRELSFDELVREDFRDRVIEFYIRQVDDRIPVTYLEFPSIARDGREFWVGQRVRLLEKDGAPVGIEAVTRDITTRIRREKANRRAVLEDRETRLLNRDGFALLGRQRIRESRRTKEPFFVLHIRAATERAPTSDDEDLAASTAIVRAIGAIVRHCIRESDVISRIDDLEIAVLAASGGKEEARALERRVEAALSDAADVSELSGVRIRCEAVVHDAAQLGSADALMTFGWVSRE